MRVRIHSGAHQIGGTCVEVEADGRRLLLDLGLPLDTPAAAPPAARGSASPAARGSTSATASLPPGLDPADPSLLGVLVSHGHADHFGLIPRLGGRVPVIMGQAAERLLAEAAFFSPIGLRLGASRHLEHGRAFRLGPFRITPHLVDHSAFDAYALLIEAGGRRLFYTGDLRAHGRKGGLFERLVRAPPRPVHALLMEGTLVPPAGAPVRPVVTEHLLEDRLVEDLRSAPGLVLAAFSAHNVDRLVTFYRACRRAGRTLLLDLYSSTLAAATGRGSIPCPGFPGLGVYVRQAERVRVKEAQAFHRTRALAGRRVYPEQLRRDPSRWVLVYRGSMHGELDRARCLSGARLIWSLWGGYLQRDPRTPRFCAQREIALLHRHTSGHAPPEDLARLAAALAPEQLVPIHTAAPERFAELFPAARPHPDGTWWEV